jgi:hypothetical protein
MTANAHRGELRAAAESERALERLYVRYHDFVRRALRKHYVDGSELEDMTQQVFSSCCARVRDLAGRHIAPHAVEMTDGTLRLRVLDLPTLIELKSDTGRARDRMVVPVLLALLRQQNDSE